DYKITANPNSKIEASERNMMKVGLTENDGVIAPWHFYIDGKILNGRKIIDFYLNGEAYELEDTFTVSDFSYDEATGALKFNFNYSAEDSKGDMVEISGKVDVIVYEVPLP